MRQGNFRTPSSAWPILELLKPKQKGSLLSSSFCYHVKMIWCAPSSSVVKRPTTWVVLQKSHPWQRRDFTNEPRCNILALNPSSGYPTLCVWQMSIFFRTTLRAKRAKKCFITIIRVSKKVKIRVYAKVEKVGIWIFALKTIIALIYNDVIGTIIHIHLYVIKMTYRWTFFSHSQYINGLLLCIFYNGEAI